MGILVLQIRKTEIEWDRIDAAIRKKFSDRNLVPSGPKGYNEYLRSETNKLFQNVEISDCIEIKQTKARKKKQFDLQLSDKTEKKVRCLANKLGIDPATLIARLILDPHTFDK